MRLFPRNYEDELHKRFREGGRVHLTAPTAGAAISAKAVAALLREFSKRSGKVSDCDSLYLKGFRLLGDLNLTSQGIEGAPVIGIELVDCEITGDFSMEYAYLKSLARYADEREVVRVNSVRGRGVTIVDMLRFGRLQMPSAGFIDFSETRLKGGMEIKGLWADIKDGSEEKITGVSGLNLASAIVGSDLRLEGVRIWADGERALDGEELHVEGSFCIGAIAIPNACRPTISQFKGELHLRGAKIGGQLIFEGLSLSSHPLSRMASTSGPKTALLDDPAAALMADGAVIGGDVFFREHDGDPDLPCVITGQIDVTGLRAGGEFHVYGYFDATHDRMRAFRAGRIHVGGDLRFGYAPWQDKFGLRRCEVKGECDFSGAKIAGKAIFSGSSHKITRNYVSPDGNRREQKQAIHLKGATIGSELWFESGAVYRCRVEGLTLTGCTIAGRLLIQGTTISTAGNRCSPARFRALRKQSDGSYVEGGNGTGNLRRKRARSLKSITANGAVIKGGIVVTVSEHPTTTAGSRLVRKSSLRGDVRLRNATVDGPVKFEGVSMVADVSGVALWASNTRFGSDVNIQSYEGCRRRDAKAPRILGELRFQGARVHGRLWVQGVHLEAGVTGVALDCFTAEVQLSLVIGSFCPKRAHRPGFTSRCEVTGLVSLVHLQTQSVTIGANPVAALDDDRDALHFTGAILMRDMKLQSTLFIANALLRPAEHLKPGDSLRSTMLTQLERWGVYRPCCIIYANYAALGTRLFVRLLPKSTGLISLYGARTGTIGGYSGYHKDESITANSDAAASMDDEQSGVAFLAQPQVQSIDQRKQFLLKENWGELLGTIQSKTRGQPRSSHLAASMVLLNIDEFVYDRTNDSEEDPPRYKMDLLRILFWLGGRPSPTKLSPRYEWLRRIVENPGAQEVRSRHQADTSPQGLRKFLRTRRKKDVVISAHRQLAAVYRDMGRLQDSYYFTRERRWLQIRFGRLNRAQKCIDALYSTFFGFGYSPKRAVASLIALWSCGVFFLCIAARTPVRQSDLTLQEVAVSSAPSSGSRTSDVPIPLPRCFGSICEPQAGTRISTFHLPTSPYDKNILPEAAKLILPLPRIGFNTTLVLHRDAGWGLRIWSDLLSIASWLLFPLALGTVTGVLRESH